MSDSSTGKTDPEATVATLRRPDSGAPFQLPNERIGRYIVVEEIGRGAMGVVLLAYDPKLHREVALKLLRFSGDEDARVRLVREAQAMAKLSHPNVVAVYDVDTAGDHLYVAMEYVPGSTLRKWTEVDRPWTEVVDMFVDAGRGLAEAHARGLVHRDFKPANVLVGRSGRPRVTDFGLVRGELEPPSADFSGAIDSDASELETRRGVVIGTPAYMAPEQFDGGEVGPASDQFAFCVALWEALHGERPFVGNNRDHLAALKREGAVRAPANRRVPRRLSAVLTRGLAPDPALRFATMEDLLEALPRRPTRWAVTIGGAAVIVAGVVTTVVVGAAPDRCEDGAERLPPAWDDARREAVQEALQSSGSELSAQTWERVDTHLSDLAARWAAGHDEACRDTHVQHLQSEAVLDRRNRCLYRIRSRVQATVDVLLDGSDVLDRAVDLVTALPDPSTCADVEGLMADVPPPDDPATAAAVDEARAAVDRVRARLQAGKPEDARTALGEVEQLAAGIEYAPLHVEIDLLAARVRELEGRFAEAEARLLRAFKASVEVGDTDNAAMAAASLVTIIGTQQGRAAEGEQWVTVGEAHAARAGDPKIEGAHLSAVGTLAVARGNYEQALTAFRRQQELYTRVYGGDSPRTAHAHHNVAGALSYLRRYVQAVSELEKSLTIERKVLGSAHPRVGLSLAHLGLLELDLGRHADAIQHMEVGIETALAGRTDIDPSVEGMRINLGQAYAAVDRLDEADREFRRAQTMLAKFHGEDHPHVALALRARAALELQRDDPQVALDLLERVAAIHEDKLGPGHPDMVTTLRMEGTAHLRLGHHRAAQEVLLRAFRLAEGIELPSEDRQTLEFTLAKALVVDAAQRERALELARSARARSDAATTEIDAFIAAHE